MDQKVSEELSREVPLDPPRDHLAMHLGHLKQRSTAQDCARPGSAHTLQDRGPQRSGCPHLWHLQPFSDCRVGGPASAVTSCGKGKLRGQAVAAGHARGPDGSPRHSKP